ncbi:hypothetical protein, partial [Vibrio parahaemolyticus]|uniref:hypothetical protein n=1 Tax=Vibrio parahaemolyticus TaxID=670 RepID=UPI001C12B216
LPGKNENLWTCAKRATFFTLYRGLVSRSEADFALKLERELQGRPAPKIYVLIHWKSTLFQYSPKG